MLFDEMKQLRWIGWAAIWSSFHPEIHSVTDWLGHPENCFTSLFLYFVSGVLLEIIYLKLIRHWGSQRKD